MRLIRSKKEGGAIVFIKTKLMKVRKVNEACGKVVCELCARSKKAPIGNSISA
jgi:hypothetical protein